MILAIQTTASGDSWGGIVSSLTVPSLITWSQTYCIVCACMLSSFNHVELFVTPWTVACQTPLSRGFFRQEYWRGLLCPPPGKLPDPGIEPRSLMSPVLSGGFFTASTSWESPYLVDFCSFLMEGHVPLSAFSDCSVLKDGEFVSAEE